MKPLCIHLLESLFDSVEIGHDLSLLELDMIDSGFGNIRSTQSFDLDKIKKYKDDYSYVFVSNFLKNKALPVESFGGWKNIDLGYMDSHSLVLWSLSSKAFSYYTAFFFWSYFCNKKNLLRTKIFFSVYLTLLNPLKDNLEIDDSKFSMYDCFNSKQMRAIRFFIYKITKDHDLEKNDRDFLENSYIYFWSSIDLILKDRRFYDVF